MQMQLFALPIVKQPYLPPLDKYSKKKYTLVLDLDETLIHYVDMASVSGLDQDDSFFLVRPFCRQFLKEMAQYYEVVIFTAGTQEYADWVIDQLDPDDTLINHRLYRQHTINRDTSNDLPIIIKDLSKIGRDLKRTLIVDNIAENFLLQKDSGIFISTWYDDREDTALKDLIPLLTQLSTLKVADVRKTLR